RGGGGRGSAASLTRRAVESSVGVSGLLSSGDRTLSDCVAVAGRVVRGAGAEVARRRNSNPAGVLAARQRLRGGGECDGMVVRVREGLSGSRRRVEPRYQLASLVGDDRLGGR